MEHYSFHSEITINVVFAVDFIYYFVYSAYFFNRWA